LPDPPRTIATAMLLRTIKQTVSPATAQIPEKVRSNSTAHFRASLLFGPGMSLVVDLCEVLEIEVCIYLRGGYISVAE